MYTPVPSVLPADPACTALSMMSSWARLPAPSASLLAVIPIIVWLPLEGTLTVPEVMRLRATVTAKLPASST